MGWCWGVVCVVWCGVGGVVVWRLCGDRGLVRMVGAGVGFRCPWVNCVRLAGCGGVLGGVVWFGWVVCGVVVVVVHCWGSASRIQGHGGFSMGWVGWRHAGKENPGLCPGMAVWVTMGAGVVGGGGPGSQIVIWYWGGCGGVGCGVGWGVGGGGWGVVVGGGVGWGAWVMSV